MTGRARVKREAMPVPRERDEQAQLFRWAAVLQSTVPDLAMLHSIPNGGGLGGGFAKNKGMVLSLIRGGMRKGYPDVGLDVAVSPFHGLRIEMKRTKGGDLRDADQADWHARLRAHGYRVEMCEGWIPAVRVLAEYLRPVLSARQHATMIGSIPGC